MFSMSQICVKKQQFIQLLNIYFLTANYDILLYIAIINCLVGLVVLNATATLEVLGSIPRSSKKCYWVFLCNSQ